MFRRTDIQIFKEYVESVDHLTAGAEVIERIGLGWSISYVLRFDDDVVSIYHIGNLCFTDTLALCERCYLLPLA